jgi:hypothetical protein
MLFSKNIGELPGKFERQRERARGALKSWFMVVWWEYCGFGFCLFPTREGETGKIKEGERA